MVCNSRGARHYKALMWKNFLLKRRNLCSTCCEILLPVGLVVLMVGLYRAFNTETVPTQSFTNPWAFESSLRSPPVSSNTERVLPFSVAPFRLALGARRLALVANTPDMQPWVDRFHGDMAARYPGFSLAPIASVSGLDAVLPVLSNITIPGFADVVMNFSGQGALNSYIKADDYADGRGNDHPSVWAAIVFNRGPPHWDYSIRMNISEIPDTVQAPTDNLQRGSETEFIGKYVYTRPPTGGNPFSSRPRVDVINTLPYPGFMTLQLMVDRWIINKTAPLPRVPDPSGPGGLEATLAALTGAAGRVALAMQFTLSLMLAPVESARLVTALANTSVVTLPQRVALYNALIDWAEPESFAPQQVDLVPFPITGYQANAFFGIAQSVLAFFLTVCLLFPVSRLIRGLVAEKETKIREGMKMMGLSDAALLGSWFSTYAIMFLITSVLITAVASQSVFRSSNKGVIFITFWLYGLSCCMFCYLISVFFSRAKTASTLGVVIFLGGFFPYFALAPPEYSLETKTAASLLSPTAFGFALDIIASYENSGVGVTPANLTVIERNFSMSRALGMIALDALLYFLLGWYVDATLPSRFREFGVARPWYFPFTATYWREVLNLEPPRKPLAASAALGGGRAQPGSDGDAPLPGSAPSGAGPLSSAPPGAAGSAHHGVGGALAKMITSHAPGHAHARVHNGPPTSSRYLEPLDASLRAREREGKAVVLTGLRKEFPTPDGTKVAVDDISLTMVEGQITCLLGHNGAGKSTTISMLTGLIPPTDGFMSVFGRDVSTDLAAVRRDLGVCPQHDVLWPELTVGEHLILFAAIKGVPPALVASEVDKAVREVGLTEKRDTQSSKLSGGQKRKLSVAIALIGGSQVVVLDEPTSGMDPYSRRSTWESLQNARAGRVIILTTHFMDEADLLGDRIAIMAQGQIKCCGSPMFLKKLYGVGYVLTVVKRGGGADVDGVLALLQSFVPEASVATNVGAELCLRLPLSSSALFPAMFGALDERAHELGVGSYGISVTTMEDVFLQVAHGEEPKVGTAAHAAAAAASAVVADAPHGGSHSKVNPDDDFPPSVRYENPMKGAPEAAAASGKVASSSLSKSGASDAGSDPAWRSADGAKAGGGRSGGKIGGYDEEEPIEAGTADSLAAVRAAARKVDGSAWALFARHFAALFIKRWHNTKRDSKAFCYQLLIPAIMLAVGLGLIKSTQPKDYPGLEMSTAPLNADRRANVYAQAGPNRVPWMGYKAGFEGADDPALATLFTSMPQGNVSTGASGMAFPWSRASALDAANTNGFITAPVGTPSRDWQRMSEFLIADKPTYFESKFAAFVMTGNGTYYPDQPATLGGSDAVWTYSVLHNTTFVHGGPTFVNVMNSAILQRVSGQPDQRITARNHPLPFTKRQANLISSIFNFGAAIIIVIAYSFIPASQVQFIVREREVNAKYQQIISGVSLPAYWLANYAYDVISYAVPGALAVALIAAFDIREWIGMDDVRANAVVGLFALYGLSVTASTYLLSWCFRSYSTASNVVLMLNLGTSFVAIVAHTIMRYVDSVCRADQRLLFIWRLIPGFNLGNALLDLSFLNLLGNIENACDVANGADPRTLKVNRYNALDMPAAGWSLVYMGVTSVVWLAMAIGVDFYMAQPALRQRFSRPPVVQDEPLVDEDEDVVAERERVAAQLKSGNLTDVILLDNLRKVFPATGRKAKAKVAVRGLSYGVPVGQVFAFLGINGAGKTTTLSMLSGDVLPSSGHARLAGYDILTQQPEVRRLLGYCPQFDALLELMTAKEHLQLYARIKGVKEAELESVVATKLTEFDLVQFANKKAGTLSGGNKRKLSVAIATIGSPQIIFLDEPSTGVDPVARRFMWQVINRIATQQKLCSIILTTHSMEEVQALSQRVGIMVGGRLRCLGSIQHLKNRYGRGYQLEVKLEEAPREAVYAAGDAILATLGGGARGPLEGATLSRQQAVSVVCTALGAPQRAGEISEHGSGWAIEAAFRKSTAPEGGIPVLDFATWWAGEDLASGCTAYVTGDAFPGAVLVERQGSQMRFRLPPLEQPLGVLFAKIESARARLGIRSYACGQTSLEQIFNSFAAQQSEEVGTVRGMVVKAAPAGGAPPAHAAHGLRTP